MKKLLLAAAIAGVATSAVAQDETKPFTMDGEFGLIVTTGNTETSSMTAGITAQQEFENWSNDYALEGLYKKEAGETLDVDSLNFLASRGQVVVYELRDLTGNIDVPKTFELAVYCKDYTNFDKMILDYDSYNPDGSLNAQLIIQMPPCNPDWKMRYRNDIETRYNNYTQTNGELVEII